MFDSIWFHQYSYFLYINFPYYFNTEIAIRGTRRALLSKGRGFIMGASSKAVNEVLINRWHAHERDFRGIREMMVKTWPPSYGKFHYCHLDFPATSGQKKAVYSPATRRISPIAFQHLTHFLHRLERILIEFTNFVLVIIRKCAKCPGGTCGAVYFNQPTEVCDFTSHAGIRDYANAAVMELFLVN